ncbi:MAG: xanthine dehydrogenase family protein molybdopterin-binding subunit [Planctomycetes bacterium]|nr:xanthine dehydrogenase family protein molybdopterin-binding subunit [Planctomycetota bacterium]
MIRTAPVRKRPPHNADCRRSGKRSLLSPLPYGRGSDRIRPLISETLRYCGPVKITWTREDEIRHGTYHAQSMQRLEAGLDKQGKILTWNHKTAFPTLMTIFIPGLGTPGKFELDQGCTNLPYRIPNLRMETYFLKSDVRIGWLRSVCNIFHAFSVNSFLDEIAVETKKDPVALRLELLGKPRILDLAPKKSGFSQDTGRLARVIKVAAKSANWGRTLPKGRGLGFASHYSFFSYVAMAIEVSVDNDDQVKVHDVYCAVDCGTVVNPDGVSRITWSSLRR